MNFKFKITALLLMFSLTKAFGQLEKQFPISMPSSNAANLGNFLETPVSKFTGTPSIGIPLYTITDGNISVPIGLGYHAGGVKVDNHPGWVGLGWSLQAGGLITRIVKGMEDELDTDLGGFYDNHTSLSDADWSSMTRLKARADEFGDPSPDEFSFSVGGISGSFLLDDQGNWQVRCDQDVKVIFNSSDFISPFVATAVPNPYGIVNYHRAFGKFTIIAGDGTKYIFGGTNDAIDYSLDFFSQNSTQWTATSWYLTQVISADGIHNINLTYERDQFTNVLYSNKYQNSYAITLPYPYSCVSDIEVPRTVNALGGNLLAPVYLKSIETSKELIQFNRSTTKELRYDLGIYSSAYSSYSRIRLDSTATLQENLITIQERQATSDTTLYKFMPYLRQNGLTAYPAILNNLQWKKLDYLTLKDKYTNQIIKQFNFNYTNDSTKRLTLLSLKESNPSATAADTIPPYRFYYDESHALPAYISSLADDWGYFAGFVNQSYELSRNADPNYVTAGTLKKIIFPTGGYKLFFFEPNDYSAVFGYQAYGSIGLISGDHAELQKGMNGRGGGIRIKSIYDYDPVSKSLKGTRFFYNKNFSSPNQANAISSGIIASAPGHRWNLPTHSLPTGEIFSVMLKSRSTIIPMGENAEGSQIGYSEVTEVAQDNSYTVSKFTNFDDGHADKGVINSLFPEKGFMNGYTSMSFERGKPKYTAMYSSSGVKLKSTATLYLPLRNDSTYVRETDRHRFQVCDFGVHGATLSGPFVYEGGAYKFYTYPFVPVAVADSSFDGAVPVVTLTNLYYDNTMNKMLTRTERIRTDGQKVTGLTLYPQDYSAGTGFIDQLISKNITAAPIEKVTYLTDPASGSVKILSGQVTTYNSTNPFVKDTEYALENPVPVSLASFKFSGSSPGVLPNSAKAAFSKDASYKSKAAYVYDSNLNLSQVNTTDGISSAVLWGYNHSLPVAQAVNAKATEIYYNGFEEETTGTSTDSKVGLKSKALSGAAYTLPTLATLTGGRKYIISFWYKNTGGKWLYSSTAYTSLPASISGYGLVDELRIYPDGAQMNTASYYSSRGQLAAEADGSSRSKSYEYDAMLRLRSVKDDNKNILQRYLYNYAPATTTTENFFFNGLKTGIYQKIGCGDKTGTYVTYAVSAGSYASIVSQADADNQATNEVSTRGLNNANLLGKCYYYNVVKKDTFFRTDCQSPQLPAPYIVTVAAGTYTSEISQFKADSLAQYDVKQQGDLVNSEGSGVCYIPTVSVTATNSLPTSGTLMVTLTNVSTGVHYSSAIVNHGESKTFNVSPGTYSISTTSTGVIGSILLKRNGSQYACGTFSNVTVGTTGNESLQFIMSTAPCPPPL